MPFFRHLDPRFLLDALQETPGGILQLSANHSAQHLMLYCHTSCHEFNLLLNPVRGAKNISHWNTCNFN
ncbi:hypothetical protein SK128_020667 [Halocaridina rubra]|uniref:Uncharacterized protein n=1 Tax=Halocaridina rubra TaxID=373956 RepID=A0AAN8X3S5_HALRR